MIDIFSLIGAGSTLTLVGLCYKLSRENNGKLNEFVRKDVCSAEMQDHSNRDTELKEKIIGIKDDIAEIKADVKELIKAGGVK